MSAALILTLRRSWRLFRLVLHVAVGVLIAAALLPFLNETRSDRVISRWSRRLLKQLGVRLQIEHAPLHPSGALFVCNHVSWLDIFVILAARRVYFVSKSEVRGWPVAGWLADKAGTLFLHRGRRADTARVNDAMRERMQRGAWVAVFPEGTTSDGRGVQRFLPSLLQPAVALGCPVVPAALRYRTPAGDYSGAPAYTDGVSLLQSLLHIVSEPALIAELDFGEPLLPQGHRRELAMQAQAVVSGLLAHATPTAPLPQRDAAY